MKKNRKNPIPYPYSKWITLAGWKRIPEADRKILIDLVKLQNRLRKHYKNRPPEEYINMNAQIEYERYEGLR